MAKHKKHHDHWKRSLVKTLTYRIVILFMMFAITSLVTHNSRQALEITSWNAVLATIIYYFHERMWSRIKWGRN